MTALADVTDLRFTPDQLAIVAAFEAAPVPPEVQEAAAVEQVARALYGAASYEAPSWRPMWDDLDEVREQTWLSLAAAAVAAYRAAQDGGAEEALRRVEALAERLGDETREFYYDNRHTHPYGIDYVSGMSDAMEQIADRITAALAPQADR